MDPLNILALTLGLTSLLTAVALLYLSMVRYPHQGRDEVWPKDL
jgi:hypothetical protein